MKKLISSMIIAVLILSSSVFAAGGDSGHKTLNNEITAFFKAFEVFDNNKDENDIITREEFAAVIVNILSYNSAGFGIPLNNLTITDIHDTNYAEAVATMVSLGYMQGEKVGENSYMFNPKAEITPAQIVKVLVELLGYKQIAPYMGGYPMGYLTLANTLGITKGVSLSLDKSATYATAKILTFKALNAETAEYAITNKGLTITNNSNETYVTKNWKLKKVEGILKANSMVHITGQSATPGDYINIDDKLYQSYNTYENFAYLGSYVRAYIDAGQTEDGAVLCIFPLESKSSTTTLKAADILEYEKLTSIKTEKTQYKINNNATVIYNFEYQGPVRAIDFSAPEMLERLSVFGSDASAEISLTDNDGDGLADFVWIRNYENILLKSFIYDTFKFIGVYNESLEMKEAFNKNKILFLNTDGKVFNPKDFEANDVISIITTYGDSGEVESAFGFVSKLSVRGKIVSISDDGVEIDGAHYMPSDEYIQQTENNTKKVDKLEIGLESLFYLNKFNMIVGMSKSETVQGIEKNIGFLYKVSKGEGLNGEVEALIYAKDGSKNILTLSSSVSINGETKKGSAIYPAIHNLSEIKGDNISIVYRVVKYQINEGKIVGLDIYSYNTAEYNNEQKAAGRPYEPERDLDLYPAMFMNSSEPSARTVYKASTIGKRVGVTSDTAVLAVPSIENPLDFNILDDDAFYEVKGSDMNGDSVFGDSAYSATSNSSGIASNPLQMAFYDVDNTLFAGIAIRYYKYVGGGSNVSNPELLSDSIIVEKIVNGVNQDGVSVMVIYGHQKGVPVKLQTAPVDNLDTIWSEYPSLKYLLQNKDKQTSSAGQIIPGDVVQVLLNSKGEIINALVLMRAAQENNAAWLIRDTPPGTNLNRLNQGQGNEYLGINYGTVVEYSDGKLVLDELDGVRRVYLLGSTTVTKYNRTSKKVSKGSVQDIEIGKQIFLRQYYSQIKEAVYYVD